MPWKRKWKRQQDLRGEYRLIQNDGGNIMIQLEQ